MLVDKYAGTPLPSEAYKGQVERMIESSEGRIKEWVTMPNHQTRWMTAPRGACVVLDGSKPVFADVFCTNMFQATAIREVSFDDAEWSTTRRRTVLQQLKALLPEDSPSPPNLHSVGEQWVESIGSSNSYVGMYSSRFRNSRTQRVETKWYVVVRAGLDSKTLRQLEDHLFDLQEKGVTARTAFFSDPIVQRARNCAARNRQRLLARVCGVMGVTSDVRVESTKYDIAYNEEHSVDLDKIARCAQYISSSKLTQMPFWYTIPAAGLAPEYSGIEGFPFGPFVHHVLQKETTHPLKNATIQAVRRLGLKFTESPSICSVTTEHDHHFVTAHGPTDLLYFNDCCRTSSMGGVVLDQGVCVGPLLLSGPTTASNAGVSHGMSGGSWTNEAYDAFPSSVGVSTTRERRRNADVSVDDRSTFGSMLGTSCPHFHAPVIPRSQRCAEAEEALGYMGSQWAKPVPLDPYLVFMSREP